MDRAEGLLSPVIKALEELSSTVGKIRAARRLASSAGSTSSVHQLSEGLGQVENTLAQSIGQALEDTSPAKVADLDQGISAYEPMDSDTSILQSLVEPSLVREAGASSLEIQEDALPVDMPVHAGLQETEDFQDVVEEVSAHLDEHEDRDGGFQVDETPGVEPVGVQADPEVSEFEVVSDDTAQVEVSEPFAKEGATDLAIELDDTASLQHLIEEEESMEQWDVSPASSLPQETSDIQGAVPIGLDLPPLELPNLFQLPAAVASPTPAVSAPIPESSVAIAALAGVSDEVVDQFIDDAELVALVLEEMLDLMPEIQQLLENIDNASREDISRLHRLVHTLKGSVGQVGAYRARSVIHKMETVMEDLDEGHGDPSQVKSKLLEMFEAAHVLVRPLITGEWAKQAPVKEEGKPATPTVIPIQARPSVRVAAEQVDRMILEVDQARLAALAQDESAIAVRQRLRELEEVAQRSSLLLRELEIQSEIQMQSRQVASADNSSFDPLELDRFTRLQELARLTSEGVADVLEVRRDLMRLLSQQDAARARTGRYMQGVADALHRARLTPADAINDRLHNVVWTTAREVKKEVAFELHGARVEMDRLLLEKIMGPLDHVLRNSVSHGIEPPDERVRLGKPRQGLVRVTVRTAAGRAIIEVSDDGAGLNTAKIRQKAIEKGLWEPSRPMSDEQASEMVCTPGFSTAESVTQISGRGVGMDAVRNSVISMGGRFMMVSRPGKGLDVFISIPTAVASAPVLLVEDGGEPWALPIDVVEQVVLAPRVWLDQAREEGRLPDIQGCPQGWAGTEFRRLCDMTGVQMSSLPSSQSPLLLLREQGKTLAVEVQHLSQVLEATLSPPGPIMSGVRGVAGALVLPSGAAALLLDPFRATILRSGPTAASPLSPITKESAPVVSQRPLVLIVDDSLTVRKAVIRFLSRHGYDHAQARDGQEALDLLERITPSAVILDVEMPRMDGFTCAQAIRENPRTAHLPLVMVTSRTAEKHRQRAKEIGVNEYLGKPFKEEQLNAVLRQLIKRPVES